MKVIPDGLPPTLSGSVVVADDGESAGRAAVAWASRHATGEVHVVRAVSPLVELFEASLEIDTNIALDSARSEIDQLVADFGNGDITVVGHVVEDSSANAWMKVAGEVGADTIVVGARVRRHGPIVDASIGTLLHRADQPVIVVPFDEQSDGVADGDGRIVVGASGDASADERLVAWAQASGSDARIEVVHALPHGVADVLHRRSGAADLEQAMRDELGALVGSDGGASVSVVDGHALDALVDVSAGASMVVVGSHHSSRLGGFLTGSIAQHLPAIATCPVAIVPITAPSGR